MRQLIISASNNKVVPDLEDGWNWLGVKSPSYEVRSTYQLISSNNLQSNKSFNTKFWDNITPLKVTTFCWKVLLDRVPTGDNLQKR